VSMHPLKLTIEESEEIPKLLREWEKLHLNPQKFIHNISNYFHLPNPCLTQFPHQMITGINASTTEKHPKHFCVCDMRTKKKLGQINQFPGQFDIRHKQKKEKYYQIYCDEMENSLLPDYISLSLSLPKKKEKLFIFLKKHLSYCWCCCWWNLLVCMSVYNICV